MRERGEEERGRGRKGGVGLVQNSGGEKRKGSDEFMQDINRNI